MTAFDDAFQSVAVPALMSGFGETITYRPRNGAPRPITGIVDRTPPEAMEGPPGVHGFRLRVSVEDDAAAGISRSELVVGGDSIEVAERKGGTARIRLIVRLLKDTGGLLTVEV